MFTLSEYSVAQFEVRGCTCEEGVNGPYERCYPLMSFVNGEFKESCVVFKHESKKFHLACFLELVSRVAETATDMARANALPRKHECWYEQGNAMLLDFGKHAGLPFLTVLHTDFAFCRAVMDEKGASGQKFVFREWLKVGHLFNYEKPSGVQKPAGARSVTEILGREPTEADYAPTNATGRGVVFAAKELWTGAPFLKWSIFPLWPWPSYKKGQVEELHAAPARAAVRAMRGEAVYRIAAATVHEREDMLAEP
jgi:hypothetical protein